MIVECPSCQARFVVDAAHLPESGRRVRCSVCRESWVQRPAPVEAAPRARRTMRHGPATIFIALGMVGAMALAGFSLREGGAGQERGDGLKNVLGGETDSQALSIIEAVYDYEVAAGGRALVVSAEVRNNGAAPLPPPALSVTLRDDAGEPIYRAALPVTDSAPVGAGQSAGYYLRLLYPPEATRRIIIDFDDR